MDLKNLKFSQDHEWIKPEVDIATIGISDYAQKELGDVVYIELPQVGDYFSRGDACSNIESVKAVNDVYSPLSGVITEVNNSLEDKPENVNQSPYEDGWIFKIRFEKSEELNGLMTFEKYEEYLKGI